MKSRKEVSTSYPDIFKILVLDNKTGKWTEPIRGKEFKARRYNKYDNGKTKRVKKSFESLAEAKAFRLGNSPEGAGDIQKEANHPSQKSVSSIEDLTFEELVEKWEIHWLPAKNVSTQIRYRSYLQHLRFFEEMRVKDIEPDHIDQWITHIKRPEYLEQGHATRCDYKHEVSILRIILNYYSSRINRSYRLPFLPDHRVMLKVKEKPTVKKDLTIKQFEGFLSELKKICWGKKWEAVYFMAIMQYAIYGRVQDAAALYVEDFDLINNRLEIKRKVQWLRAKNFKNQIVPGSKTNGGKIFSPIPELAIQILKEWMLRSGTRSGLLFRIDGEIITYRTIQQKYDRALKNANLPFTSTHILRHAALVEAYNSCQDILAVQRLAGHSDLRATERYAKVRDNRVAEVQRRMDENLSQVWKK